ncbi:dephospho-CoA kinase [Algoriphagus boritolerans]|uniref:Dephospho-CoA kinase n=1 Tax=Algoriphagus boritolerans DSM 17298 = JCM 18970 TaxID=1120964 RepID=A0A1H5W2N7_9BACT|nr:dephospho-CoA kinase [Algoriphagus boritolerans]SEF93710.1 dephospho-CoA kinase [Algoriphagus boritolerans DSM 17298 = JCM 18970]
MNNSRPIRVGITGGIGSGKSTVCRVFKILGIPVYAADDRAKWLMSNDSDLKLQLTESFGPGTFLQDGTLNRAFLAQKVFSDPERVKMINALVHPAVGNDFKSWAEKQTAPYLLKEAALLFETNAYKELDKVINVSSPLKIRMARILMRDPHRDENQVNQIINQQLPDEKKNELADFVIKNTENKLLIPQILEIHKKLSDENS